MKILYTAAQTRRASCGSKSTYVHTARVFVSYTIAKDSVSHRDSNAVVCGVLQLRGRGARPVPGISTSLSV